MKNLQFNREVSLLEKGCHCLQSWIRFILHGSMQSMLSSSILPPGLKGISFEAQGEKASRGFAQLVLALTFHAEVTCQLLVSRTVCLFHGAV